METSLLAIFDEIPCTIVQGTLSNFGVTLKICKKSNPNPIVLRIIHTHHMYLD